MRFNGRRFALGVVSAGLAAWTVNADRVAAGSPDDSVINLVVAETASPAASVAIVESLIDDAMADGKVGAEERNLILSQARRRLSADEVAGIESRLASMAAPRATLGTRVQEADDAAAAATATAKECEESACCDEAGCGGCWDNMYVFSAGDSWMGPIDDDDANNFGMRFGFNLGMPLSECRGIGVQLGGSYGIYNFHGRDSGAEQSSIEEQLFITAGVFKRADLCAPCPTQLSWGIVYDHLIADNIGEDAWEIGLGQIRWQCGYALSFSDEVGLMGSFRTGDDEVDGTSNNEDATSAIDQGSVFWHHKWVWGTDTTVYTGITEDVGAWIFGMRGEVPVSNCVSLFGGVHYILPSTSGGGDNDQFAQEIWNVSVGVAYYPGGNAVSKSVAGRRWMPLMPVADNGSFALDISPDRL
jgi:hypothetical protein